MRINNRSIFKPMAKNAHKIDNKSSADETTVYLYDEISWFGIDAAQFVKDFNAITSPVIHVRVNSPGGSVFDGTIIYNAIKQHKSKTIVHIDGLAASIASVIAMAGNEIYMADNAFMMIHDPFSLVVGTAQDMREEADLLDKVAETIARAYSQKSGAEESKIKEMMASESWMTAQEALDNGFIDEIEKVDEKLNRSHAVIFDLSAFANVPNQLKDQKKDFSVRDIENILKEAGVSQKMAKSIIADGFKDSQRDVENQIANQPAEPQRDVEVPAVVNEIHRDDEPQKPKRDRVSDLLIRAEKIAPSQHKQINKQNYISIL